MKFQEKCGKNIENYSRLIDEYKKRYNLLSMLRLGTFLVTVVILWYLFKVSLWNEFAITVGIFLIVFIFMALKHQKVALKQKRLEVMLDINKKNVDRINYEWINFDDDGSEYKDEKHNYSEDLDIFGKSSLFQLINISNTFHGRECLRELLTKPDKALNAIKSRQEAVKEIADKIDFSQKLQCEGILSDSVQNEPKKIIEYINKPISYLNNEIWVDLSIMLPILTVGLIALSIAVHSKPFLMSSAIAVIIQIVINGLSAGRTSLILGAVNTYKNSIEAYENLFKYIEGESFDNDYLKSLKANLFVKNIKASSEIEKLKKISERINCRYNPFLYFVLNATLMWDLQCVLSLERWKMKASKEFVVWLETIGSFEALSSLALLCNLNEDWDFPKFNQSSIEINAKALGHPLIPSDKRICNDFHLNNNTAIVTGSNMSGKSTFLRIVGINLVLAYAGAPVCAKSFVCPVMDIYTSMRVTDDISIGVSMFYAELLRIKAIIEKSKDEKPLIFLIDEIFRGTNSKDRILGARNVIRSLNKPWTMGLVSTHDLELGDIEKGTGGRVENYHFSENYKDEKICFDYILREGISKTTNATYLMKMVGIDIKE